MICAKSLRLCLHGVYSQTNLIPPSVHDGYDLTTKFATRLLRTGNSSKFFWQIVFIMNTPPDESRYQVQIAQCKDMSWSSVSGGGRYPMGKHRMAIDTLSVLKWVPRQKSFHPRNKSIFLQKWPICGEELWTDRNSQILDSRSAEEGLATRECWGVLFIGGTVDICTRIRCSNLVTGQHLASYVINQRNYYTNAHFSKYIGFN